MCSDTRNLCLIFRSSKVKIIHFINVFFFIFRFKNLAAYILFKHFILWRNNMNLIWKQSTMKSREEWKGGYQIISGISWLTVLVSFTWNVAILPISYKMFPVGFMNLLIHLLILFLRSELHLQLEWASGNICKIFLEITDSSSVI
jgi:hypothetical protein